MNFFDETVLRLKQQLRVTQDQDVAAALGFSKHAWSKRKSARNFPETELYALAAKRPELGLDVGYVLTGERMTEHQIKTVEALAKFSDGDPAGLPMSVVTATSREFADINRRRKFDYTTITETLNGCTDDDVKLVLQIVTRLRKGRSMT
jgi:transcriptional regulator with XRE-family HTH domain